MDKTKQIKVYLTVKNPVPSFTGMEQIYKKKTEVFNRIFEVKLMPGISELLAELRKRGHKIGLVTGSRYDAAKAVLRKLVGSSECEVRSGESPDSEPRTPNFFDVVIAGEMVSKGKPNITTLPSVDPPLNIPSKLTPAMFGPES